jgi:hypothetical protein
MLSLEILIVRSKMLPPRRRKTGGWMTSCGKIQKTARAARGSPLAPSPLPLPGEEKS